MNAVALIPATKICIIRSEGPTELCNKPMLFTGPRCWTAARAWLFGQSETFPANGCYDKHDFTVEFADGERYSGTLDCKASDCDYADLDVAQHVRTALIYMSSAGREEADTFLRTYEIP